MIEVKRVLLFVNYHKPRAPALAEEISRTLGGLGIEVVFYPFEGGAASDPASGFDAALCLGGDGTVLHAARTAAPHGIPILPINIGTLGFIAAVRPEDWESSFREWAGSGLGLSKRLMLELFLERRGESIPCGSCLNDVVISALGIAKIIRLQVSSSGGEPVSGGSAAPQGTIVPLGFYRSDGLIVATPTGSTGYSVAAGGPILDPEIEAVIINPICPFTLSNRPIVVPAGETVIVQVQEEQRSGVLLTMDGQVTRELEEGDSILIRRAPYEALLIASGRQAFYRALQTMINGSGGVMGGDSSFPALKGGSGA
jgi:NAD+ kinase